MNKQPLTVSALTKYLKYRFDHDTNLQNVILRGEVSNFKHHSKGHFYFTLKDEQAQINAVMFASHASGVNFKIENGMRVLVEGYVSVYVGGGSYQIYIQSLQIDGVGDLFIQFEQLKNKLADEGLFDERHKLPLPKYPHKIAIITSKTGAAIQDILTTLERRYPLVEVILFPTLVQGKEAKEDIVRSIRRANTYHDIDIIILGRGGGSIEDLWCFNEEVVAKAIFDSKIPIITGIGHETDFTIADFVSDLRAPTPSSAAEMAVRSKEELFRVLNQLKYTKKQIIYGRVEQNFERLRRVKESYVFAQPNRIFEQRLYKLDTMHAHLEKLGPIKQLEYHKQRLEGIKNRLNVMYERKVEGINHQFIQMISKLDLLNPFNVLKKGYGIIKKDEKRVLTIHDLAIKDEVAIHLYDGVAGCIVYTKEVKENE